MTHFFTGGGGESPCWCIPCPNTPICCGVWNKLHRHMKTYSIDFAKEMRANFYENPELSNLPISPTLVQLVNLCMEFRVNVNFNNGNYLTEYLE